MDQVYIQGLQIETIIGVNKWERTTRQTISIDIELFCDTSAAGSSDDLTDALDYSAISSRVTQFVKASRFKLIEALAEQVAELVLAEFGIERLRLRVSKPGAVGNAGDVGVVIERGGV